MHPEPPRSDLSPPEFSRPIRADQITAKGSVETIAASPEECRALAERFELEAIDGLSATLRLRRVRGGTMIRVEGDLRADVVQTCVVTLDPVRALVEESFSSLFAPPDLLPDMSAELDLDPAGEDEPEPLENGRIDLGELTAQHLSLALDPYPRAPDVPDAPIADPPETEEPAAETPNPFSALAKLRRSN